MLDDDDDSAVEEFSEDEIKWQNLLSKTRYSITDPDLNVICDNAVFLLTGIVKENIEIFDNDVIHQSR